MADPLWQRVADTRPRVRVERVTSAASGGGFAREEFVLSSLGTVLAGSYTEQNAEVYAGFRVVMVEASHPCRIRFYTDPTSQSADVARAVGVDPADDSGVLMDVVLDAAGSVFRLSPAVEVYTQDGLGSVDYTIDNNSGTDAVIDVTVTLVRSEL